MVIFDLSSDPAKISAIKNCSALNNIDEVRCLLGMTNYNIYIDILIRTRSTHFNINLNTKKQSIK